MSITILPDQDQFNHAAARAIVQVAREALTTRGRFTIALSGGSTPKGVYPLLALAPYRDQIDWNKVEIFWGDERCVSPDDAESNYRLAYDALLSKLAFPADHIHRMPADLSDRTAASAAYEEELRRVLATNAVVPSFDLIHLGLGPEGHTASLFPHQASLHERQRLVLFVTVPKPPPPRLTFTPPILNAAKHILFLVTGTEKADAVHAVLEGDYQPDEYPAQIVHPTQGEVTWILDRAAASKLQYKQ